MTYTVWHRGRCLGESPLDFIYREHKTRTGFLHPTPLGEKLLPLAGGTCAAANALHRAARRCTSYEERKSLPEYAAYEAAIEKSESFQLELRGADGSVIPTRDVYVRDYGFIDELGDDAFPDPTFEEELADEALREEFGEETLASMGLDDWNASWDPGMDEENSFWDFEDDTADELWRAREEPVCERPMSRFQVTVELIDDASVP
jgi:hypothetical protein